MKEHAHRRCRWAFQLVKKSDLICVGGGALDAPAEEHFVFRSFSANTELLGTGRPARLFSTLTLGRFFSHFRPAYDIIDHIIKNIQKEMNRKEQWSVLRYLGPDDGRLFSLTPGRCYYWPSSYSHPVYSGVVDDEEYTSYFHPVDPEFWEILEDPTGMAYETIYGTAKNKYIKKVHDHIMRQVHHAMTDE